MWSRCTHAFLFHLQLLPHFMVDFDHIFVALRQVAQNPASFGSRMTAFRAEVASMFLPMETRFDENCWWHAQSVQTRRCT
jgi:hypothetical protein